jgi:hypothetical protein
MNARDLAKSDNRNRLAKSLIVLAGQKHSFFL